MARTKINTEQHKTAQKNIKTQQTFRQKPVVCVFRIFYILFIIS